MFTFVYTFILLRQAICKLRNYREVYIYMFNVFINKKFRYIIIVIQFDSLQERHSRNSECAVFSNFFEP